MLRVWGTVTTAVNTALGVTGLGVAVYAISVKPSLILFYYGVAAICVLGSVVGFVNMWFLNEAARRSEEKNRTVREEREKKKAERAAKKAEKEAARAAKQAEREAAAAAQANQTEAETELPISAGAEAAAEETAPVPFPDEAEADGAAAP